MGMYSFSGLCFTSEIVLPEFGPDKSCRAPHFRVINDSVPLSLPGPTQVGTEGFIVNHDSIVLIIEGVASYCIEQGHTIRVDVRPDARPELVRFHLIGFAFSALLFQRGHIPLHAGCAAIGNSAIAICGFSRDGKSTLMAGLAGRGYKILTDDRLVLAIDDGHVLARPGIPTMNLSREAAELLRGQGTPLRDEEIHGKRTYSIQNAANCPVPLSTIIFLQWYDGAIELVPINSFEAMCRLREQVNYESYLRIYDREAEFLEFSSKILSRVRSYVLRRSRNFTDLPMTLSTIESLM